LLSAEGENSTGSAGGRDDFLEDRGRFHYGWVILVMGVLVVTGSLGLARFGYTPVLPPMQEGLGLDNTGAGFLASANLAGYATLSLIGGALAARFGPRTIIAAGLILAGSAMLLTALAQGFTSAALARTLTGIGSGLSNVPVMGLVAAWFVSRRRGLAAGIVVTGSSFGLIFVGPLVPRFLAATGPDGWRWVWVIYGSITLLLGVISYLVLRNRPTEMGLRQVGAGPVEPRLPVPAPASSPKSSGSLRGGLSWSLVYRSAPVYHLAAVYTAFGFSYFIYLTFFTKYLITEGGYDPNGAGNLLMMVGWFSLLCGVIWGTVSDVIGRRGALIIVYLIQAVAFGLFGLWQSPIGFVVSAILFGLTAWSIPAIIAATCGDVLGPRLAPAALGFVTLFFAVGQALGPPVAGGIADRTGSFALAFVLAGVVALLGALAAGFLRPASTQEVVSRAVLG
jgi:MFS family permease